MSEWIIALSVAMAIFAPFGAFLAWDIIEEKHERRLDEKSERRVMATCDAHMRLIGLLPQERWGRFSKDRRKIIYPDGSVWRIPKSGPATITGCQCGRGSQQ